jgi:hypothetical protein
MNTRQQLIEKIQNEISDLEQKLEKIKALPETFDNLELEPQLWGNHIDFNYLEHDQVTKVISAVGGKWNKTPESNATINYEQALDNGLRIRCYSGKPPPNCKIVEVIETIPAVPERTVTVRKLVCQ